MSSISKSRKVQVDVHHVEVSSDFLHFWARELPEHMAICELSAFGVPLKENYLPCLDEVFTMKTSNEGRGWQRFKLISPIKDGLAKVDDLDYGGVRSESISDPRPLSEKLVNIAPRAKEYRLAGCMFPENDGTDEFEEKKTSAKLRLEELVATFRYHQLIQVKILSRGDVPQARLFHFNDEKDFASKLVEEDLMIEQTRPRPSNVNMGNVYHENLVMLLLLRCNKQETVFNLTVNDERAGKFQKIVLALQKENKEFLKLYMHLKYSNKNDKKLTDFLDAEKNNDFQNYFVSHKKLDLNIKAGKKCILYTNMNFKKEDLARTEKISIKYQKILEGPALKVSKKQQKVMLEKQTQENKKAFKIFLQEFAVVYGQPNVEEMKKLVFEEISELCRGKKKETRNLLNSFRCWTLDWMQKEERNKIDNTILNEFLKRNLDELHGSDMIGQIKITDTVLGKGRNSVVFIGLDGTHEVAVKRVACRDDAAADEAADEADILRKLDVHKNIVGYRAMDIKDNNFFIVMEKCFCTLEECVKKSVIFPNGTTLDKKAMMRDILDGLYHLHMNDIVHRDLSPRNILVAVVAADNRIVLKISDFGNSRDTAAGSASSTLTSTKGFIPPECFFASPDSPLPGPPSDMYVLGLLVFYIWTDGKYFERHPSWTIGFQDVDVKIPGSSKTKDDYLVENALTAMLKLEQLERPTCSDLLSYPLFWTENKVIDFYEKVNHLTEDCCKAKIEAVKDQVFCNDDWTRDLPVDIQQEVVKDIKKKNVKTYEPSSLKELVRAVRNFMIHKEVNGVLQPTKDKILMVRRWHKYFPELLPVLWTCLKEPCRLSATALNDLDPDACFRIKMEHAAKQELEKDNLKEFYP